MENDYYDEFSPIFVESPIFPHGGKKYGVCRFTHAVSCPEEEKNTRCGKCGWNPAVAEIRSREIRRRLALEKGED